VNSTLQLKVQRLFEHLQAKGSTDKFVSLSEGDRRCSFEAIIRFILPLFYYYYVYHDFSYYSHYSQNKNGVADEYSLRKSSSKLSRGGTEAGNHHSAGAQAGNHPEPSSTTSFPCPMDGPVAAASGWAAYVALMYLSQPLHMA
jgi:hypothetical protein